MHNLTTPTGLAQQFNLAGTLRLRDELILVMDGVQYINWVEGWIQSYPQELQLLLKNATSGIRLTRCARQALSRQVRLSKFLVGTP